MLDRVKKAVMPSSLETEREQIQNDMDLLNASREELRLERGLMVVSFTGSTDSGLERRIKRMTAEMDDIDAKLAALRDRRRHIDVLLKPVEPVKAALVDVKKSDALIAVQDRLDAARQEREDLNKQRLKVLGDTSDVKAKKFAARITDLEDDIRSLRIERERLLRPYYDQVGLALQPLIRETSGKAVVAVGELLDALKVYTSAAEILPVMPGMSPKGIHEAAYIDRRPLMAIAGIASALLASMPPEIFEEAAE
jgi:Uri superfamily endonuclease